MAIKIKETTEAPPAQTQQPEVKGSKQVKVEADKKVDEKVQIDFMSDSFSQDHASKKTKENTETPKSSIPLDKKVGEIREDIAKSEAKRNGDQFTFKDILQIATFIINAIDGGFAILLNFIARDNRVSVYTLPAETKRQLADQLALILVKYQVKFKIEFLFLVTLILAYMGPVAGAIKNRKTAGDREPAKKGPPKKETTESVLKKEEPPKQEQTQQQAPPPQRQEPAQEVPVDEPTIKRRIPRRESRKRVTTNG